MGLGERIIKFSTERKISFDGESYHLRLPIDIVKTLLKFLTKITNVHWSGIWKNRNRLHVILTFDLENFDEDMSKNTLDNERIEDEYVVLRS